MSSVPDSLPPELDDIDSSWDDDIPLDESAKVPVGDPVTDDESDRVTSVPSVPVEEYAAKLMAELDSPDATPTLEVEHDSVPDLEFDEPDFRPGPGDGEDALPSPDEHFAPEPGFQGDLIPDLPSQPPSALAPDPKLSLGMPAVDPRAVLPLVDQDVPPPPPRARPAPSQEFDDLSLDLSDPQTSSLDLTPAPDPTPAMPSLELDLGDNDAPPSLDPATSDMKDRYAMGDFTGALVIAESILENDPEDLDAKRYAQSCREVLTQMYAARLGQLDQRVVVAIPPDQIRWLSLDHRAGFLLSLIDGSSSIEELLDISGMTRLDALRILYNLLEQRVIALEPA